MSDAVERRYQVMVAAVVERAAPDLRVRSEVRAQLRRLIFLVVGLDTLTISLAILVALQLKFGFAQWPPTNIDWFTGVAVIDFGWLLPVWVASLAFSDAYSRRQFARGSDEFKALLKGSASAAALVAMLAYLVNYDMSRGFFALAFGLGTAGLLLERYAVRRHVARQRSQQPADAPRGRRRRPSRCRGAAPGAQPPAHAGLPARRRLLRAPRPRAGDGDVPLLGGVDQAVSVCREVGADTLLIAGGSFTSSVDLRRIGWELEGDDIDLIVVPSLIDVAGPRIHMRPVAGLPFVHVEPPQVARAMKWGKAIFDRLGSLVLLVALSPLFALVALAIKVESGGPVFFRHGRIGVQGQSFGVWKFRSMVVDAAAAHQELVAADAGGALLFKLKADPRVTRVGAFIRRYSLDELPQLLNVLRGDMSLVGPRPQVADEVAMYDDSAHRRLLVRPGMTGLWQVSGRSDLTLQESMRLDLYYVDNWSMIGDLVILAKTLRAVVRHDGAY